VLKNRWKAVFLFLRLLKKQEILSYYSGGIFLTFGAMMVLDTPIGPGLEGRSPVGLVTHLLLIALEDVLTVLDPDGYPTDQPHQLHPNNLLVKPDTVLHRIRFTPGLCQFGEAEADGGYALSIEATLNGYDSRLLAWQHQHQGRRWLALIRQVDEQCWLVGNPELGLGLSFARASAAIQTSKLTLSGQDWHPTWSLPTIDLAALFPDAAFDYSLDLSFDS
jgi:hypothetical protein